jgi:uncharacterized protein (TIGR02145 family)
VEGNVYKTIQIEIPVNGIKGSEAVHTVIKIWMVESMITTRYSKGYLITATMSATLDLCSYRDDLLNYQWAYGGNESNVGTYGRLYIWGAVTDSLNICRAGWQVPTKAQWTQLAEYLGGVLWIGKGWDTGQMWAGILKENGTGRCLSPNRGALIQSDSQFFQLEYVISKIYVSVV